MKKLHIQRLCAALAACAALMWLLPLQFQRVTAAEYFSLSGAYSAPVGEFVIWEHGPDHLNFRREDGTRLNRREAVKLMPLFFVHDTRKWGGFPLRLGGRTITADEAASQLRAMFLRPRMWNATGIPLHTILESDPEGANLTLPPDVVRILPTGPEFINCADGSVNAEKSRRFADALRDAGVRFPLSAAGGNASPRKPFDMGLLLADADNRLFRLQMTHGLPHVHDTGLSVPGTIRCINVEEDGARDYYGIVVTDTDVLLAMHDDTLLRLPTDGFNADRDSISARFDSLNIYFSRQRFPTLVDDPLLLTAADRAGNIVRQHEAHLPPDIIKRRQWTENATSMLFPLALQQYTPLRGGAGLSPRPQPDLMRHLGFAAAGALVWCALLALARRKRGGAGAADYALTILGGLPGLLAVLAFGPLHAALGETS